MGDIGGRRDRSADTMLRRDARFRHGVIAAVKVLAFLRRPGQLARERRRGGRADLEFVAEEGFVRGDFAVLFKELAFGGAEGLGGVRGRERVSRARAGRPEEESVR